MGWGSATGLRVIGVATKKSFPASRVPSDASLRQIQIRGPHYPIFLPEILICCHRYKNVVPRYSILRYIIGGRAQKRARSIFWIVEEEIREMGGTLD